MGTVLLQQPLSIEQIDLLLKEFPQHTFFSAREEECKNLEAALWEQVEIFFGSRLAEESLNKARQLRWVHLPFDDLNHLCINEIWKKGNVLVSKTAPQNSREVARYVIAAVLAFSKHFFQWKEAVKHPALLWDSKWKETLWDLSDRQLLQIGLNSSGLEVARQAQGLGMKVWGVQERRSFQPYCDKIVALRDLHSVLPQADVVVLSLPKDKKYYQWFGQKEISLLKEDSILVIVGSNRVIDEQALAAVCKKMGRLRGIVIDNYSATPIHPSSPLWTIPNIIITPDIASLPNTGQDGAFYSFRHNLRQYLYGNFGDMDELINPKRDFLSEN